MPHLTMVTCPRKAVGDDAPWRALPAPERQHTCLPSTHHQAGAAERGWRPNRASTGQQSTVSRTPALTCRLCFHHPGSTPKVGCIRRMMNLRFGECERWSKVTELQPGSRFQAKDVWSDLRSCRLFLTPAPSCHGPNSGPFISHKDRCLVLLPRGWSTHTISSLQPQDPAKLWG